ncbi:MAG TPA: M20/M25/M40 family metallo-hydrolase [Kofleriaceae bacterium]|jgi:hypothetical protein
MRRIVLALVVALGARGAIAQTPDPLNRIVDQGVNHSQVMQTAEYLTDRIGSRMTNSPGMRAAEAWTQDRFKAWGLKNVRKDGFVFGRGWYIKSSVVRMIAPRVLPLTAIPVAWTPSTNGTISAPIVVAPMKRERDFETWKGKLRGQIVLISLPNDGDEPGEAPFKRLSADDLAKLDVLRQGDYDADGIERRIRRAQFMQKLDAFLKSEGALAWVKMSYRDGKLVHGEGYGYRIGETPQVPGLDLAAEDYRRLARLAKAGAAPRLEITSDVAYDDSDPKAYDILAEIPGTDPGAGYVMAGAHLDSWAAADGATDNGAGTVVVMEAARILAATGVRPRRTIRFALWAGEEEGLLGSMAYVEKYLATRAPAPGKEGGIAEMLRWRYRFPVTPQPGHKELVAYFNIDNGSGKIRGIHAEGNVAAVPLLREWLAPFTGFGATAVVAGSTGGTDHVFMQAVGIPGYQFIQDPLDYSTRTHHSSVDTFDHLKADDLREAATVLAGVLYESATSARTLPRMPVPTLPTPANPYHYDDPDDVP